jgi:hypothetical protein
MLSGTKARRLLLELADNFKVGIFTHPPTYF